MTSVPPVLRRSFATCDLLKECFLQAKQDVFQALESKDYDRFHEVLDTFHRSHTETILFINAGSIYPALSQLIQKGSFQAVLNGIEQSLGYEDLITPEVQFCYAACFWELGEGEEAVRVLTGVRNELGGHFNAKIDKQISKATGKEKEIYEDLMMNFNSLSLQ